MLFVFRLCYPCSEPLRWGLDMRRGTTAIELSVSSSGRVFTTPQNATSGATNVAGRCQADGELRRRLE